MKGKPLHSCNIKKLKFNYVNETKHSTPLIKEWFSSVYGYNKKFVKSLPTLDSNLNRLICSHFNLYNKFQDKINSKNLRIRTNRFTINKFLISKPNIKHTGDKINIIIYAYNERSVYFFNKIGNNMKNIFVPFVKNLKNDMVELELKLKERTATLLKEIVPSAKMEKHTSLSDYINKIYIINYVKNRVQKEIISVRYRQSIYLEQSKQEKLYLLPLIALVQKLYNKEIVFNIVNLKYIYNSSNIFSNVLISKLNDRKNKLLEVLGTSLDICEVSPTNKFMHSDMYKERVLVQRLAVQDFIFYYKSHNPGNATSYFLDKKDILDRLLLYTNNDIKLITPDTIMNNVIKSLKHKQINGVRIEVAGRLTKNSKAQRSMFKFNYKGSLKNTDSSQKGLPVVLLRGYAKTNVMYTQCKSKFRVGAYGLKTWISST